MLGIYWVYFLSVYGYSNSKDIWVTMTGKFSLQQKTSDFAMEVVCSFFTMRVH